MLVLARVQVFDRYCSLHQTIVPDSKINKNVTPHFAQCCRNRKHRACHYSTQAPPFAHTHVPTRVLVQASFWLSICWVWSRPCKPACWRNGGRTERRVRFDAPPAQITTTSVTTAATRATTLVMPTESVVPKNIYFNTQHQLLQHKH